MTDDKELQSIKVLSNEYKKQLSARLAEGQEELELLQKSNNCYWEEGVSVFRDAMYNELANGSKPSEALLKHFPKLLGSYLPERFRDALVWAVDACRERPCQTGLLRRSVRSSRYEDYVDVVLEIAYRFVCVCVIDEELADILSGNIPEDAKAYSTYSRVSGFCSESIAYALNSGDAKVEELIRASLNGEPGAPTATESIFRGVLLSDNRSLQELLGKLLVAARLQEGTRQAICECADEGTTDGFRLILKVIADNNLIRFSSVKRAAFVWTGLGNDDVKDLERISDKTLQLLLTDFDSETALADAAESDDVMKFYMALWSLALRDQRKAVEAALEMLDGASRPRLLACGFFARALHNKRLSHALARDAFIKNPDDQELLALVLPLVCEHNVYDQVYSWHGEREAKPVPLSTWFRDENEARTLLELLFEHLTRLKTKTKTFQHCVFPWLDVTLTKSDLAKTICYVALLLDDETVLDRALDVAPLICADDRAHYVGALTTCPKRASQFRALYAALVDRESTTREVAFMIAEKLPVAKLDVVALEKNLRLKSDDLRSNCIQLLMKQDDAALLASFERLLGDSNEQRRRGAYDLAVRIGGDEARSELAARCAELLRTHEPEDPKERLPWNNALLATEPEKKTEEKPEKTGLNFFDESDAYAPDLQFLADDPSLLDAFLSFYPDSEIALNPTISNAELLQRREKSGVPEVCPSCEQARKDLRTLENLIEKHKGERIEDMSGKEGSLGFTDIDLPYYYSDRQTAFPLADLWEEWYASLGAPERLVRVVSLLLAETESPLLDARVDFLCGNGFSEPQKLAYQGTSFAICAYLWRKYRTPETFVKASLAAAEWFTRSLPLEDVVIPEKNLSGDVYCHCLTSCPQIFWPFEGLCFDCPDEQARIFAACAAIYRRFTSAVQAQENDESKTENSQIREGRVDAMNYYLNAFSVGAQQNLQLKIEDYLLAAFRGDVTERELAEFAFRESNVKKAAEVVSTLSLFERVRRGRIRKSDMLGEAVKYLNNYSRGTLSWFFGEKENLSSEDDKFLSFVDAFYEKFMPVILENEFCRGDVPAEYSKAISALRYCVGVENLGRALAALASAPLKNGYWNPDGDRSLNLCHLIETCIPASGDDAESFARVVKEYAIPTRRLVELALFNPSWLRFVGEYLGKPGFESAAFYFIAHVCETFDEATASKISRFSSLTDEELLGGAFDAEWFRSAYETLGEKDFAELYNAAKYIASGARHSRARRYADATLGKLDLAETEAQIREKRNKDLLAAYTLIPLKDEDDTARRFSFVQEFIKGSRQFSGQRAASERAAAEIALKNLAATTGDKDVMRLTLRMEARFASESLSLFEPHEVEDLVVRLSSAPAGGVAIVCTKNDKELKSVPARVKKDPYLLRLAEAKDEFNNQYSRTRVFLETAMIQGLEFSGQELRNLLANPNLRPLVEKLIFQSGDAFGLPGDEGLLDAEGKLLPWSENQKFTVVHPHTLYKSGVWGDWRRRVFETKTAQPFKQAFRELYLKTDEELEHSATLRYAGYQIQPTKAVALLKKRGWSVDWYDGISFYDRSLKITASLETEAFLFSPADVEAPTIEGVGFFGVEKIREIPEIFFSEIMRDVDLTVSVAYAGGVDPEASHSTMEMRAELLRLTLPMFGLTNVKVDDRRAIIEGTRANYLVHLGSGVVHQEGGAMISIAAVQSQHRGMIFLPFVDDDPQTAEILTKILFLAEDSKIRDPQILQQIDANNARRS